jgi:class 3 adenylate cyclase
LAEERVQGRLAAVLAADVAGYSRLMGLDEEGTLAQLKALRRTGQYRFLAHSRHDARVRWLRTLGTEFYRARR